jgi:hypothetical protein
MMQVLKDIGGVELPETLAKFTDLTPSTDSLKPRVEAAVEAGNGEG